MSSSYIFSLDNKNSSHFIVIFVNNTYVAILIHYCRHDSFFFKEKMDQNLHIQEVVALNGPSPSSYRTE